MSDSVCHNWISCAIGLLNVHLHHGCKQRGNGEMEEKIKRHFSRVDGWVEERNPTFFLNVTNGHRFRLIP